MKQILFSMLFVTLFVACDKNPDKFPDLTKIRIKERPCEMLEYVGKIGNSFDIALDSLRKLKNISSEIVKEPLEVLFDYDNRKFYGIVYGDCGMYTDVLDTKGNYYLRTYYCTLKKETLIHKPNFGISGGIGLRIPKALRENSELRFCSFYHQNSN